MKKRTYVPIQAANITDVNNELQRISNALDELSRHVPSEITFNEPNKLTNFDVYYADGIKWNPGKGAGLYILINEVWMKITLT
ncbi:hypothetical protein OGY35_23820 [Citrobacter sp. Ct235]|uniref:hypothetical protein n=1 Tax=Citrobacter sp. Ct235 TaxID=2985157 RepID=UPI0025772703|nr:hypothetical protein [Citrobacter sp. Ct235]MDM2738384.1 hypothetical protein [Citrobacter sp. Ct235]